MLILAQSHLNIKHSSDFEFLPTLLADMDHHAIHGGTHAPICLNVPAGRLPLLWHGIRFRPLGLSSALNCAPHVWLCCQMLQRDIHLSDLLQDLFGLLQGH